AVDEALDIARLGAGQREHLGGRGRDAVQQVLGGARHLGEREPAAAVQGHDVGEGPADVHADLHARSPPEGATLPYRPCEISWTGSTAGATSSSTPSGRLASGARPGGP